MNLDKNFTVLLPIYFKDEINYFISSVESLLNQTILPDEILVLVDGPISQKLDDVISEFKRKHPNTIKVHKFKENRGLGLLLNDGVKLAKNNLIARMDSDDVSLPYRFKKQIDYFFENNADVLGGQVLEYSEDMGQKIGLKKVPCNKDEVATYSIRRNPINHMSVMFKKSVVLEVGNYKDFQGFEDYVLWLEIIKRGYNVINMPDILVNVRAGDNLIIRRRGLKYFIKEFEFQKYCYKKGYIKIFHLVTNMIIRIFIRLSPKFIVKKFYEKRLRENS